MTPVDPEEAAPPTDKGKGLAVEGTAGSELEQSGEEIRQKEFQH